MRSLSVLLLTLVVGCEKKQPAGSEDAAPQAADAMVAPDAVPLPPEPTASTAATTTTSAQPPDPTASLRRTSRAVAAIGRCASPPPADCTIDTDCAIFDIATADEGGCASTLRVGIAAPARASYLAGSPCPADTRRLPHSCVVHWVRAEDGPDQPPGGTEVGVHCVAAGRRRVCRTHYVKR